MLRYLAYPLACASAIAASGAAWALSPPNPSVSAIVGSYDCVTQDGSGKTWRFRSVNSMWGAWLRADTTFAPQNGRPRDVAHTFVGFDAATKRWNIVSIDADGSYYTRYSTSREFNGSHWADGYPADGGRAVIGTPNPRRYTFDFTGRPTNGKPNLSHTVCTRL